jgi:hypothetical protein
MKNTIVLNFGGFYNSIHDESIDSMLDSYYQDDDGNTLDYYSLDIPYKTILNEYSRLYIDLFSEWLNDEYSLDVNLTFSELISPREYNFSTDRIIAFISKVHESKLLKHFKNDLSFLDYLKQATKSYDGYISFYDYESALKNKDGVLSDYLTQYLCNEFNDSEFINYYDRNNGYELLYGIDMPILECEGV